MRPPILEFVETLRDELERQGIPSRVSADGFPATRPDLVYVLVDPRTYVEQGGVDALPEAAVLRRTIVLGSERPEAMLECDQIRLLRSAGAVFDLEDRNVAAMRRLGIDARPLKPGYAPSRDHYDPDAPRPIDVTFIGTHSLRRTELLRRYAPMLAHLQCELRLTEPEGDRPSALGPERWALLSRSKILVNLHQDGESCFETLHAMDAIHAGAVVVSEHSSGVGALEPGRHLLVGDADSLPFLVEGLLAHEPRLRQMRAAAYERLRSWLPFALSAAIFRAAVIEVLGTSLHPGVSLGRRAGASSRDAPTSGEREPVERRLHDPRDELLAARSELAALRRRAAALRREMTGGPSAEIVHRSPGFGARVGARVSVLVPVLDEEPTPIETLDSIAASRLRDVELIVVAAAPRSIQRATDWARERPWLACAVIADRAGRGRGGVLNLGLDRARSAFCLVADPGVTLHPRALPRMADLLESMEDVAFVYPMVEVTGARDWFVRSGGDYLLNVFDWDPALLRAGNPIQPPYLLRARVLRDLHGFAADGDDLDGFEDYDLWTRIAERGGRGQLLAQIMAARSERPGASTLLTIRPVESSATSALESRAPRTMADAFGPTLT